VFSDQRRSDWLKAKPACEIRSLKGGQKSISFAIDQAPNQITCGSVARLIGGDASRFSEGHSRRALLKERFSRFARNESPSPDDNGPERPVRDHRVYFGPSEPNCATEIINAIR
jgi:hypothetical protein